MCFLSSTGTPPTTSVPAGIQITASHGAPQRWTMRATWWTTPGGTAWRDAPGLVSQDVVDIIINLVL